MNIVDKDTVWWFKESLKLNPGSTMAQICESHEELRKQVDSFRTVIKEMNSFLNLNETDRTEEKRQELVKRTAEALRGSITLPRGLV